MLHLPPKKTKTTVDDAFNDCAEKIPDILQVGTKMGKVSDTVSFAQRELASFLLLFIKE